MKKSKNFLITFSLSLFFIVLLFLLTNPAEVVKSISKMKITYLFGALILVPFQLNLRTLRWKLILSSLGHEELPFLDLLNYTCIGIYGSSITPSKLGDIVKSVILTKKNNVESGIAVYSSILDRIMDIIAILIFSIIGFFQIFLFFSESFFDFSFLLILALGLVFLLLYLLFDEKKGNRILNKVINILFRRILGKYPENNEIFHSNIIEMNNKLKTKTGNIIVSFLFSFIIWILFFIQTTFVFYSMHVSLNFFLISGFFSIALIAGMIPITISGLGTRESSVIILFSLLSVSPDISFLASLVVTFISQWVVALIGAILGATEFNKIISNE